MNLAFVICQGERINKYTKERGKEKRKKQEKELRKKNTKRTIKTFPYKTTFLASSDDFLSIQIRKSPEIIKFHPPFFSNWWLELRRVDWSADKNDTLEGYNLF